jgi:hypothetical protein
MDSSKKAARYMPNFIRRNFLFDNNKAGKNPIN